MNWREWSIIYKLKRYLAIQQANSLSLPSWDMKSRNKKTRDKLGRKLEYSCKAIKPYFYSRVPVARLKFETSDYNLEVNFYMAMNTLWFIQAAKRCFIDLRRHLVWRANNAKVFSVNVLDFGLLESTDSCSQF